MSSPALSVLLLAPVDFLHIQKTVRHLRAQTRAAEIELLIGTPTQDSIVCDPAEWQGFHSVQIVPVGEIAVTSLPKWQLVKMSHAPIIAFAEDHAFPAPNWADALLQAHQQPYAAVSVEMRNANPSGISRADMQMSFGEWIAPALRGTTNVLPGHNTSYKRSILEMYCAQQTNLLDSEAVLHAELRRRKHQLFLETRSHIQHLNISAWLPFLSHKFRGGRVFGGLRAEHIGWNAAQRLVYVLGAPFIPFLRLKRMIPNLRRTGELETFDVVFLFALALGLAIHTLGAAVGYAFGPRDSVKQYAPLELHRAEQLDASERQLAFD